MHFHFNFSANDIIWTLTFASLLVLLVVLLGRDRARRYPWFTASMVLMTLRLLASRMLFPRLPQMTASEVFLVMADLAAIIALLVAVEVARRAFAAASRTAWIVASLVVLAVGAVVLWRWGPWPSAKTLFAGSTIAYLRLMQLFAQKIDLLSDVLVIQVGLLVVFFGRAFKAGWRTHTQQIAIGLSTASIAQLAVRVIWQAIALHTTVHTQTDYERVMSLQEKIYNANDVVFLVVLVWWIACLWMDEPGTKALVAAAEAAPAESAPLEAPPVADAVDNSAVHESTENKSAEPPAGEKPENESAS